MYGTTVLALAPAILLAQALPEPYTGIAQYGLAGLLGVLLIRRYENELSREREGRLAAETRRDALTERAASETIPLLGEVQRTMVPALAALTEEMRRMADRLERVEHQVSENGRKLGGPG
ncbi:MAG TPA: hypothetical protein VJ140_05065 [Actinomycetota bacterium]|nr:hypothetical protein [Actinomycetota bacterium]